MASDRVIVNAGGRRFETTTTTLMSSGSAYFLALLGYTGSALGSLPRNLNENDSAVAITPHTNGRKRTRTDDGADIEENATERPAALKEVFVDRDPDLFENILYFMRSNHLPSKVRKDMDRLEDLKDEALFFGFQELGSACENALKELRDAIQEALKPEPKPKAKCYTFKVEYDEDCTISVPKGEVLFVASATLAGKVHSRRYKPSDKVIKERRKNGEDSDMDDEYAVEHCYLDPSRQGDSGDFQLLASVSGREYISIAHVAIDYSTGIETYAGMNLNFREDLGLCLAPFETSENRNIRLNSSGSGDWHVVCWVGEPSAIPQLHSCNADTTSQKLTRIRSAMYTAAASNGVASNTRVTSALTVAALALFAASLF